MIDFDTTIVATKADRSGDLEVNVLTREAGGSHPYLAQVGPDKTLVYFNDEGESRKGNYTFRNVTDAEQGKVAVPAGIFRARHARYGVGTLIKTRDHATRKSYMEFADGSKRWVVDRRLQAA